MNRMLLFHALGDGHFTGLFRSPVVKALSCPLTLEGERTEISATLD